MFSGEMTWWGMGGRGPHGEEGFCCGQELAAPELMTCDPGDKNLGVLLFLCFLM